LIVSAVAGGSGQSRSPAAAPKVATYPAATGSVAARLQPLRDFEEQRRRARQPGPAAAQPRITGADPYLVRALPGGTRLGSILRGAGELVLLDGDLRVVDRVATPPAPTGLAVTEGGDLFVSSELSPTIVRYSARGGGLQRTGAITLGAGYTARDIAVGPGPSLYAVDERQGLLITLGLHNPDGRTGEALKISHRHEKPIGRGPIGVARVGSLLLVNCLLEHAVVALRVDRDGRAVGPPLRIQQDGPLWSFDAVVTGEGQGEVLLAVGGVEDHPLDRRGGSFGYIDSFLTLYRISTRGTLRATRTAATNLSELGLVTPKVVALARAASGGVEALVTGYGSSPLVTLSWRWPPVAEPGARQRALAPGTTSVVRRADGALVFADPLLDAWLISDEKGEVRTVPVPPAALGAVAAGRPTSASERDPLTRVGEALFFTTLMAPWNQSVGPLSRFTCETCHFEGYTDGRTHHTGRGDVRVTTKPLRGLFNNRPHFSRALDPDLTTVADNEFRVAGAKSDHDPWFSVKVADFPWLHTLGVREEELGPVTLRRALMSFLMDFTHAPNPTAVGGGRWNAEQRAGAGIFRERCESCHQARVVSDDPGSRLPFSQWERVVMSEADSLIWGLSEYRKTGILPYVHDKGARVPSLRRLYKKFPYFTNGTAKDLGEVIARARFKDGAFLHDPAPAEPDYASLDPEAARSLKAFLELL
jgi:hypothetical protein